MRYAPTFAWSYKRKIQPFKAIRPGDGVRRCTTNCSETYVYSCTTAGNRLEFQAGVSDKRRNNKGESTNQDEHTLLRV